MFRFGKLVIGYLILFGYWCLMFGVSPLFAQQSNDLEISLDVNSATAPLPKIFKPNIDLSGRGFHRENNWPQTLAAKEALDTWQKEIGFNGVYRLQYNLWEINERGKEKEVKDALLRNYEDIIKRISDAGGIVILDIFGTPAGLGKVLDKRCMPVDLRAYKELVKGHIRSLSCEKRYNIWYEVWSAPDLDDFFLGRTQEYLNLYRAIAESARELEAETKVHIPVGGPGASWWFQGVDGNTTFTPERSLIYELIKFCSRYKLPLDFISWHAYSTDQKVERDNSIYNNTATVLIRDWLTYFNFERDTPLIITEWNYDSSANILPARGERFYIGASFIPSRIINMHKTGINYQLYFCLEDFQNIKEGVVRNVGIFSFDPESSRYKGNPKGIYNVFRMMSYLGDKIFTPQPKLDDKFVDILATKGQDYISLLISNYIDPYIATSFLSRNVSGLNKAERQFILSFVSSDKLDKFLRRQPDTAKLRTTKKVKALLKKTQELNDEAMKFRGLSRDIKIEIKNLKGQYLYKRYALDSSYSQDSGFNIAEEKEINVSDVYQETLSLPPYSVNMIIIKNKPPEPQTQSQ